MPVKEDIGKDVAAEDTLPGAEFTQERKDAGRKAEDEGFDLAVNKAISCEMHPKTAQEDSQRMENVPFAPFATETEVFFGYFSIFLKEKAFNSPM